jgi:hypothetical protein
VYVQHTVIDNVDFGIAASALRSNADLYTVPLAAIEARGPGTVTPTVPAMVPAADGAALAAMTAEMDTLGITFNFDGETYFVQPADQWDVDVFEYAEEGKFVSAVKRLIGPAQWRQFKGKRRVSRDVEGLFAAAQRALGTKSG